MLIPWLSYESQPNRKLPRNIASVSQNWFPSESKEKKKRKLSDPTMLLHAITPMTT
jgi:hypothetical protein